MPFSRTYGVDPIDNGRAATLALVEAPYLILGPISLWTNNNFTYA